MINTAPFIISSMSNQLNYNSSRSSCSDNTKDRSDIAPYTPMRESDPQAFTEQLFKKLGFDKIPDYVQRNLDKIKKDKRNG